MLADARRVSHYLRATDRVAYEMLSTRRIAFHRKQAKFTSLHVGPVLEVDKRGNFSAVRLSYFTMDPWVCLCVCLSCMCLFGFLSE